MTNAHLGSDTDRVSAAGKQVTDRAPEARGLAGTYLARLSTGSGALHHPRVIAALVGYYDTWRIPILEVTREIDALGAATSVVASTVAWTDSYNQALLGQQTADGVGQASMLSRNPNHAV